MSAPTSEWVFDVGQDDFEARVVEASFQRPIVVDFWAEWCAPCRALGPLLERLVRARDGEIRLAKVNVDEAQALASYFQIEGIPAVKAIREGRIVLEFTGVMPEAQINEFLDRLSPSESDHAVRQAEELEKTNAEQAKQLYRQVLEKDPDHERARVGLARVLIGEKNTGEVEQLLEPIGSDGPLGEETQRLRGMLKLESLDAGTDDEATMRQRIDASPDDAQAHYELGCHLAKTGKHQEALDTLLSAAERDFALAEKVREAMVQVFYAIGVSNPMADEYRSKLARLLY